MTNGSTATRPILWIVARLVAMTGAGVVAIVFLSSWVVALIVGGLTIAAVAADGFLLARDRTDPVPAGATPSSLDIDLRRRR